MADAAALHIGPELQAIRRHAPEILRRILLGRSVHPDRAVLLSDDRKLVGNNVLLRRGLRVLKHLLELGELGGVLPNPFAVLRVVGRVGHLQLGQRNLLRRVVGGADLVGALEGDVLKHVRQPACTLRVVRRAGIHQRVEAEHRRLRPLADDQGQPVGEHLHRGPLLKAGEVLRHVLRPRRHSPAHCQRQHYRDQSSYSHETSSNDSGYRN